MKKRMLAGLMAACILWTTLPVSAFQEDGPAEPAASAVADGDTRYGYKNVLGEDATSTQNAGRMWVDHTVSTANSLTFDDGGESETITREEGEDFLVTYSALSSTSEVSILPDTTPSDTIFVLDFSMTMNRNMNGDYVTDNEFSTTRTKAMLDAMDETITTLKQANEDNRVGIVTFCGLSDVLLPLTRLGDITAVDENKANAEIPVTGGYQGNKRVIYKTENRFFSVSESIPGGNNRNWVRCNIEGGEVNMLSDWTSMQAGLYEALKMFRKGWPDGTEQDLKSRRANVIVITDGDSNTLAKQIENTPWYENMTTDEGGYNQANGGNLAFATLLTAAYLKYEAGQRYESCSMYTVGLSTTELMQLLLNPSEYMKEHSSESIVTSTQSLWNQYQTQDGEGKAPPAFSGITFEAAKDANDSIVPENYDYVDEFFDTNTADDLADAFRTITEEIILAKAQPPTDVPEGGDPTKSGYVTYTAPLGEYMEVKDVKCIIFQNQVFKEKSTSTSGNCTTYVFTGEVDSPVYDEESLSDIVIQVEQTDNTHQTVTIQIPASVMPMRSNTIRLNSENEIAIHETKDDAPMRIVYSVGLMDEVDRETLAGVSPEYIEENTADDGTVLFYCNAYDKQEISEGRTAGSVTAEFTAGDTNPFYYAPAGTVLYTYENGNYMVATEYQEGITYYVKQDYYYKDGKGDSIYVPGWLGRNDLNEKDTKVETLEDGSKQLVLSRSILKKVNMANARNEKREGDNRSETADYAYYATEKEGNLGEFLAYLGNNGRLGLENPLGELTISKTVQAAEGEELPENAKDTEFTLKLTAARDDDVPLTGTFFCEVYNSEDHDPASDTVTFDPSGTADLTIKSGQVIRLFLPKGTSITVSETPTNGYTVSYKDDNTAAADDKGENFAADTDAADIQVINTFTEAKIDILVKKVWNDNNDQDGKRPESITVKLLFNGSEGTTLTLSNENGWQGTFTGLDQYDDGGNEITYTIEEVKVEGYETSITGSAAEGFVITVTNTHTPETVTLSGAKTWNDANDQDGKRPSSITIRLYANGAELKDKALTVTADNGWKWSFTGLPKYADGEKITYTISEDAVEGYTPAYDGLNVTNTYTPEQTSVTVTKAWDDKNDQDGKRPESITVKLLADGQETKETLTLSSGNNWTGTFTGLDKYQDGQEIAYTIEEVDVNCYSTVVTGDASTGFTITNSYTPETISISGSKTWDDANDQDGKRPESITVSLLADGSKVSEKEVTASDNWTWTFENLPKYKDGKLINYTIQEETVPGYTPSYSGYNVTNSYTPGKVVIPVTKSWQDNNDQDGLRPQSVTVKLLADGKDTGKTLILSEGNGWSGTFTGLDEYAAGEKIAYTVEEVAVNGYDTAITGDASNGFTITNAHNPETITLSGAKTWNDADNQDGKRPDSITIRLYANGTELKDKAVTVTADDGWKWSFAGLPKYADGKEITYTISEDAVDGYTPAYTDFDVTNTYTPEQTSITVTKAWADSNNQDGLRPESITVKLLADGEATKHTLTLSSGNNWTGTFSGLDKYRDGGEEIVYTIEEVEVSGYDTVISGDASKGFVITNSHTPATTEVSGSKTWDDANDQDGKRPSSITIRLYANGKQVDTKTVTAKDDWKWSFTNLPKYADGKEITYTITEDTVPGYTSEVDGYNVTNSYTPGKTSVTVTKAWNDAGNQDGLRPAEITVKLLADGKDTGKTLTLSKENRWMGIFTDLDEYKDGQKIVYTVEEVSVKGYDSVITGDASTGFVITNSHTPEEIDLSGSKTWDDAENQDGKRPDSITIRLYANGEQVQVVTVTADDGWKWNFTNLPKYENGEEIRYTITEDAVPGYQSEVNGMDVTNHYTPGKINIPVTKNWQDKNDADGIRPDSITVKLYADGKDTGRELVLDQENNWAASFDDLDEYADGVKISYTIAEVEVDGYDTSISGSAETGFVINNSHTPDTPDKPDDPDDPDEPGKPTDPDDPDEPTTPTDPDEPDKPNPPKDDTPQTGDTTNLALWIGLLAISATGFTATLVLGKKKRYRGKHMR